MTLVSSTFDVVASRFESVMTDRGPAAAESAQRIPISFRKYQPGDITACAHLAKDAWPGGPAVGSKELELMGMQGYMEYSLSASNWADIAYSPEGVIGFLFGRIDKYSGGPVPKKAPLGEVPTLFRSFLEYERRSPRILAFIWSIFVTELKQRLNTPKSDASVEMFIVDSRYRGRGIGNELMDRFLKAAKDAGSSLVTVYTEDLMSNWRFYENRGFRRVATFRDNITSHYSGSEARGIIFALDLRERTRNGSADNKGKINPGKTKGETRSPPGCA